MAVIDLTHLTDTRVYDERPDGAAITGLLLHHTAGTNEDSDIWWLSQYHTNPVSTHKVIKRNGDIVKLVPEAARAWHAGKSRWAGVDDCNDYMIGIELCNRGDGEAYTNAQYRSLAETIAYDTALYHIRDCDVTSHMLVRMLWNIEHPNNQGPAKNDPYALNMTRLFVEVWNIRANWPAHWGIPFWHHWLNMSGQPR